MTSSYPFPLIDNNITHNHPQKKKLLPKLFIKCWAKSVFLWCTNSCSLLLPANEDCEGNVFTGVCLSTRGRGESLSGGSLSGGFCPGVPVQGGSLSGKSLSRGSLFRGVSGWVSVQVQRWRGLCLGGLRSGGGSLSGRAVRILLECIIVLPFSMSLKVYKWQWAFVFVYNLGGENLIRSGSSEMCYLTIPSSCVHCCKVRTKLARMLPPLRLAATAR